MGVGASFVGCGDDATSTAAQGPDGSTDATTLDGNTQKSDGGGAELDGGQPEGSPGVCIANDSSCVDDAGNNRNELCCTGLCPGHLCHEENISDFSATCAPAPCGGGFTGTWHVVGGCGTAPCPTAGRGSVRGTLTITLATSGDGGNAYNASGSVPSLVKACSRTESTWSVLNGFFGSPNPGTIDNIAYCVSGADLWMFPGRLSSDVAAIKLAR